MNLTLLPMTFACCILLCATATPTGYPIQETTLYEEDNFAADDYLDVTLMPAVPSPSSVASCFLDSFSSASFDQETSRTDIVPTEELPATLANELANFAPNNTNSTSHCFFTKPENIVHQARLKLRRVNAERRTKNQAPFHLQMFIVTYVTEYLQNIFQHYSACSLDKEGLKKITENIATQYAMYLNQLETAVDEKLRHLNMYCNNKKILKKQQKSLAYQ